MTATTRVHRSGSDPLALPRGFDFGVATSAYQIEGAWDVDGRGPSVWDTFSQTPGMVLGDVPGDNGVRHYERMESDVELLRWLGVDSYRFSLSWSRILPDGVGTLNQRGVDFYRRLLDRLEDAGISPSITLYHWDLPQGLEDRGGWRSRDVQFWFAEYAQRAFEQFGRYTPRWATLNEPIANWVGYGLGIFAPGYRDELGGRAAMHNALLAHGQAVRAFRAAGAPGEIGIVVDVWPRSAAQSTPELLRQVQEENADSYEAFLNPLFRGDYSTFQRERWASQSTLPEIGPDDFALITEPIDFFGLNVYNRVYVDGAPTKGDDDSTDFVGGNFLDNGHFYDASVAYEVLMMLKNDYGLSVPIYVTENGSANCNEDVVSGRIHDGDRIAYVRSFLEEISRAVADGVDVRGYSLWSFLDNYEWSSAYSQRYGIIHVDLDSFERIPKDSAYWYREIIRARSLNLSPGEQHTRAAQAKDTTTGHKADGGTPQPG